MNSGQFLHLLSPEQKCFCLEKDCFNFTTDQVIPTQQIKSGLKKHLSIPLKQKHRHNVKWVTDYCYSTGLPLLKKTCANLEREATAGDALNEHSIFWHSDCISSFTPVLSSLWYLLSSPCLSLCLPNFVEDLHHLFVDDKDNSDVQTHAAQPRNRALVEPKPKQRRRKWASVSLKLQSGNL